MEVAIKRLHAGMAELEPEAVAEFQREASRMQAIRHPNLVTFYGAGTDASGEPFLVFEMMHLGCEFRFDLYIIILGLDIVLETGTGGPVGTIYPPPHARAHTNATAAAGPTPAAACPTPAAAHPTLAACRSTATQTAPIAWVGDGECVAEINRMERKRTRERGDRG